MQMWYCAFLISLWCPAAFGHGSGNARSQDLITNLPGLKQQPNFKQYSGYLQASDKKFLHYWLVESQRDPMNDPLVLWLNGGPGCSSIDGFLTENGPFRIDPDGETLSMNPYGWNMQANVLYMESPAGVGYSYATDKNYTTNDNITAMNNHAALQDFLVKFPEYSKRDFYVTGESYAGIYIPTLLVLLKDDSRFNLKGAAIGNGYMEPPLLQDSLYYYYYYHGLIGNVIWGDMLRHCCKDGHCVFFPSPDKDCQQAVAKATVAVMGIALNPYDIIGECYRGGDSQQQRMTKFLSTMANHMKYKFTDKQAIREVALMGSRLEATIPCMNNTASTMYMNLEAVRKALHIKEGLPKWAVCSNEVHAHYHMIYDSMSKQFISVLKEKRIRILVYNGDMDMACNFLGDQMFVDNLRQKETISHKPWYYTAKDGTKQIGGFVRQFENLAFMTVRGAGHMVPTDRPIPAMHMITTFLENKPF